MRPSIASLLSTASVASCAAALQAADAAAGTWLQLVPAGTFKARDGRGPFVAGDRAAMDAILSRTRQYHGSTEILIDYDHQSVFGAKDGVGGTAKAAGWIKELQVRDAGIFGRVEWTEAAAAAIRAGEYRYLSPVIPHVKADGRIIIIFNAALTNTPALEIAEVAASALFPRNQGTQMDKIAAALGLAKGSAEDAILAALNAVLANGTAIAKALGLAESAKPADALSAVNALVADRGTLAQAAGLQVGAKTDDIVTAVKAAMSAGNPDPTKFVPIAAVTELQTRVNELSTSLTDDKAAKAVEAAMTAGKLSPALKDWGLDLHRKDPKAFETFVGSAPALTQSQLTAPKKDPAGGDVLDDAQIAVCKALGISEADFKKTRAAEAGAQGAR